MDDILYAVPKSTLIGIADAIRAKTESDEQMEVFDFASAVEGIMGGATKHVRFVGNDVNTVDVPIPTKPLMMMCSATPQMSVKIDKFCALWTDYGSGSYAGRYSIPSPDHWAISGQMITYSDGVLHVSFAAAFESGTDYDLYYLD